MLNDNPIYLNICTNICKVFSDIIAAMHFYSIRLGFLKIPSIIYEAKGGVYSYLRNIWFCRLFRRVVSILVRTPLRIKILRQVNFEMPAINSGSVIITCHTPWSRLLLQWCLEKKFALVITNNKSNQNANTIKKKGKGFNELRFLIRHLRSGGRIIMMVDIFNNLNKCSSKFLEKECNVSLVPARLAKMAHVPLISVVPELLNGTIHINTGPRIDLLMADPCAVMQNFLSYFEKEIRRNPSIWSELIRNPLSSYK